QPSAFPTRGEHRMTRLFRSLLRSSFCAVLSILFTALLAYGQFDTAAVLGTVVDSSKLPIGGSSITLTNLETGISQTTATNEFGDYQFFNVKIGRYRVTAEAPGFKTARADEVTVVVNARQRVDLALQVGDVTETVVVEEAVAALETDSS